MVVRSHSSFCQLSRWSFTEKEAGISGVLSNDERIGRKSAAGALVAYSAFEEEQTRNKCERLPFSFFAGFSRPIYQTLILVQWRDSRQGLRAAEDNKDVRRVEAERAKMRDDDGN